MSAGAQWHGGRDVRISGREFTDIGGGRSRILEAAGGRDIGTSRALLEELERFLFDVNRNSHRGFPGSRKSDSSVPSAAAEGCHGEGLLERLARACGCDGRGGREPAGGRACAQPCSLYGSALA